MKIVGIVVTMIAGALGGASAQNALRDGEVVTTFSMSLVTELMAELDIQTQPLDSGPSLLLATTPSGNRFVLNGRGCAGADEKSQCSILEMAANFNRMPVPLERVNHFHLNRAYLSTVTARSSGGGAVVGKTFVVGGVTRAHMKIRTALFLTDTDRFYQEYVRPGGNALGVSVSLMPRGRLGEPLTGPQAVGADTLRAAALYSGNGGYFTTPSVRDLLETSGYSL